MRWNDTCTKRRLLLSIKTLMNVANDILSLKYCYYFNHVINYKYVFLYILLIDVSTMWSTKNAFVSNFYIHLMVNDFVFVRTVCNMFCYLFNILLVFSHRHSHQPSITFCTNGLHKMIKEFHWENICQVITKCISLICTF